MIGLPLHAKGEKSLRICLAVSLQYTNVTDIQTDGQTPSHGIGRVMRSAAL